MRRTTLLTAALMLILAPLAMATPMAVKGAKCNDCHVGAPKDKKLNPVATKMFAKYKIDKCKDCHTAEAGKLTIPKKK